MENYKRRLHEAYERRQQRIETSLEKIQKTIEDAKSGKLPQQSEYLFPEMGADSIIKDLEDRKRGLELAADVTNRRRMARFAKSVLKSNQMSTQMNELPTAQPSTPNPYSSPTPQSSVYTMGDPRWARYGFNINQTG